MSVDTQSQQSELKRLIIKGKEQGFLTYREINDHLPEDMNDTDQIETVVNMINDLGIEVYDAAPDADTLLLKTANSDDEEVVEEAEAVLTTAVESEFGRTTDPVRMYMREMGTVELLTRQDEIRLAKRIEDGIRQSVSAIACAPIIISELVRLADNVEEGKMKLTELLVQSRRIDDREEAREWDIDLPPPLPTTFRLARALPSSSPSLGDVDASDGEAFHVLFLFLRINCAVVVVLLLLSL